MSARRHAAIALALVSSCALPALTVDPDLDEDGGEGGGGQDTGGTPNGGSSGSRGGTTTGGSDKGGTAGQQGGSAGNTGGTDNTGGTGTGGKGGSDTGGKGGATTGGATTGGATTGGATTGGATTGGATTGGTGGCSGGLTLCGSTCINTDVNELHCGRCNNACDFAAECNDGSCLCHSLDGVATYLSIEDFEDNDNIVGNEREPPLRIGYWYVFNDTSATCTQYPPANPTATFVPNCGNQTCSVLLTPPSGSQAAGHMAGGGCTAWGAGMGFDFTDCAAEHAPYNATVYNGIRFWYLSATSFRLIVGMTDNLPIAEGGLCNPVNEGCYNHHGYDVPPSPPNGTTITVPFNMLNQEFGTIRAFNKSRVSGIQFQVDITEQPYDIWIDDLAFVP